jgi:hypothetical protein
VALDVEVWDIVVEDVEEAEVVDVDVLEDVGDTEVLVLVVEIMELDEDVGLAELVDVRIDVLVPPDDGAERR